MCACSIFRLPSLGFPSEAVHCQMMFQCRDLKMSSVCVCTRLAGKTGQVPFFLRFRENRDLYVKCMRSGLECFGISTKGNGLVVRMALVQKSTIASIYMKSVSNSIFNKMDLRSFSCQLQMQYLRISNVENDRLGNYDNFYILIFFDHGPLISSTILPLKWYISRISLGFSQRFSIQDIWLWIQNISTNTVNGLNYYALN